MNKKQKKGGKQKFNRRLDMAGFIKTVPSVYTLLMNTFNLSHNTR